MGGGGRADGCRLGHGRRRFRRAGPAIERPVRPRYYGGRLAFPLGIMARPGTLVLATQAAADGGRVLGISLRGLLGYAEQPILTAIADLMPLLDDRCVPRRIVVVGDFSIHTHSNDHDERRRAGPILAAMEALGLVNLVRDAKERGLYDWSAAHLCRTCRRVGCGWPPWSRGRERSRDRSRRASLAEDLDLRAVAQRTHQCGHRTGRPAQRRLLSQSRRLP